MKDVGRVSPVVTIYEVRVLTSVSVLDEKEINRVVHASKNYYLRNPVLDLNR